MNKSELINAVACEAEITKAAAGKAVDATLAVITQALSEGEKVALVGFGMFSVKDRSGRTGRDPRTGEPIEIPAARNPSFKPGRALREAVKEKT